MARGGRPRADGCGVSACKAAQASQGRRRAHGCGVRACNAARAGGRATAAGVLACRAVLAGDRVVVGRVLACNTIVLVVIAWAVLARTARVAVTICSPVLPLKACVRAPRCDRQANQEHPNRTWSAPPQRRHRAHAPPPTTEVGASGLLCLACHASFHLPNGPRRCLYTTWRRPRSTFRRRPVP